MTPPLNEQQQALLAEALISEIKAEMGRRDLSSRGLGRLIEQNSQYVSMRLDGGNPRTGKRVALTVQDVAAIASALGLEPFELLQRAQEAIPRLQGNVAPLPERRQRLSVAVQDEAAREGEE